jgi:hypothetical protein
VRVLISDNSVLVNLRNGDLLETAFGLPWTFAVPDLLADAEIYPQELQELSALGLQVVELDPNGIAAAQQLQANKRRLSLVDCFSLTLAEINGWCLLTDDRLLRKTAQEARVDMHGSLWVVEAMAIYQLRGSDALCEGVGRMVAHPTARLPAAQVNALLQRLCTGQLNEL